MKKEFNHEKIKEAIRTILTELGDDPDREGLKDTPDRVARMYDEIFEGMRYTKAWPERPILKSQISTL